MIPKLETYGLETYLGSVVIQRDSELHLCGCPALAVTRYLSARLSSYSSAGQKARTASLGWHRGHQGRVPFQLLKAANALGFCPSSSIGDAESP